MSQVTNPAGKVTSYTYDATGDLTSVTDPLDRVTSFTYGTGSEAHLLPTMTDPDGGVVTNVYNASGQVTSQTDPMGLTTTYAYAGNNFSTSGGTTTTTDPHGNVEVQSSEDGLLMSLTKGVNGSDPSTWTYAYTSTTDGVTTVTDPDGHTTTYTYDAYGNKTSVTDALGNTTTTTYNAFNEPLVTTDPMGVTTTDSYDSTGNLLSNTVTGTGGSPTETTPYDVCESSCPTGYELGDVESVTDPAGDVTNEGYDTYGDLTSVATHPSSTASDTTKYVYNVLGQEVCEASPDATATGISCPAAGQPRVTETTTYSYDADGELLSVTDAGGNTTSYAYDADGSQTSVTNPTGNVTKTTYDHDDRVTSVTQGYSTSSASITSYGYDIAPGSASCSSSVTGATYCTTTTDPNGLLTTDYYNAKNQLIESVQPNAGITTDTYNVAGNLVTQTTPGGTATYGYDADNRLTSITYSNPASGFAAAPNVTYTYNADSQRTKMTDGTGTTDYTYDSLGRLSSTTNGAGSAVSDAYNLDNQVTSITYPGTHTVTQRYNSAGQESSVTDWLGHKTSFSYDADGNLTTEGYPNSTSATYAYNATDQSTNIAAKKGSTTLGSFSSTRNADGLVATETDTGVPSPTSQTYAYDPLIQLSSTSTGSYTYDPTGDPTKLASGATLSYSTGTEELASLTKGSTTTNFTYNAQGDRTASTAAGASATYSFDQAGRLVGFSSGPITESSPTTVSAGGSYTCAAGSDEHVYCWGFNRFGQLGNDTTTNSSTPVEVHGPTNVGHLSTVTQVSAGTFTTCALTAAHHVYCWGTGGFGQLGNGTRTSELTPVEVHGPTNSGDLSTVTQVAPGTFSCALTSAGHVYCWGTNTFAELGIGTETTTQSTPVEVHGPTNSGYLSTVTQVSKNTYSTCALTSAKNVYCWGTNAADRLDNGTDTSEPTPAEVHGPTNTGYLSTVTQVAEGTDATCAVTTSKHVYCWGRNTSGQLGIGTTTFQSSPVEVHGPTNSGHLATIIQIATNYTLTCAITVSKHLYCWGYNGDGELGNGTTAEERTPVEVHGRTNSGYLSTVAQVTTGFRFVCALVSSKAVCWGHNNGGELGNGTTTNSSVAVQVSTLEPPFHASYAYNGDGLRMSKTVGSTEESFTWNVNTSSGNPYLLVDGTYDYVYGPGGLPLEQIKGTTVLYYVHDQLGSTRILTNSSGSVAATYTYDPYGTLEGSTGSATNPFGFAGAYTDTESGLLYLVNRYYDPVTGQFLSVDPAVSLTDEPYSYTTDDPVNSTDPSGEGATGTGAYANAEAEFCGKHPATCYTPITAAISGFVSQHWHVAAQVFTVVAAGLGSAWCISATAGLCALALPEIGGLTGAAVYGEGGGQHTLGGYLSATAQGAIGGSIALVCAAGTCAVAGSVVAGGALTNGLWGAAQGAWDYANSDQCHTATGYVSAGANGFAQGGVPWDEIFKFLRGGE